MVNYENLFAVAPRKGRGGVKMMADAATENYVPGGGEVLSERLSWCNRSPSAIYELVEGSVQIGASP